MRSLLHLDLHLQAPVGQKVGPVGRKLGRPIIYTGDPNDPELTNQERRRIKRRTANRDSARRVRLRRSEELDEISLKVSQLAWQVIQFTSDRN